MKSSTVQYRFSDTRVTLIVVRWPIPPLRKALFCVVEIVRRKSCPSSSSSKSERGLLLRVVPSTKEALS
eukprot:scaffold2728_cov137-Skeletonema_marinoi.AAC.9